MVDGITFDSKGEAGRYSYLRRLEQIGLISDLVLQPTYLITIDGIKICKVILDFAYIDTVSGGWVFEDFKGVDTAISKLKRKLVEAQHKIKVMVVKK